MLNVLVKRAITYPFSPKTHTNGCILIIMEEEKQNMEDSSWWSGYPRSGDDPEDDRGEGEAAVAAASGATALAIPPSDNFTSPSASGDVAGAPAPMDHAAADAQAELYFLIANFLSQVSPCSQAADVLKRELVRVFIIAGTVRLEIPLFFVSSLSVFFVSIFFKTRVHLTCPVR